MASKFNNQSIEDEAVLMEQIKKCLTEKDEDGNETIVSGDVFRDQKWNNDKGKKSLNRQKDIPSSYFKYDVNEVS